MKPQIHCPANSMSDEKITIYITGLETQHLYTIHTCAVFDNGNKFESCAVFKSSKNGTIDLATDSALAGSYNGCDAMGIFWSMSPSLTNKHPHARFMKSVVTTPLPVTICVYDAHLACLEEVHNHSTSVAQLNACTINRWFMAQDTRRIPLTIEKDGVSGTMFLPGGPGPFPGVIVMFGGQPGIIEHKASLLASHGFATLTPAIFGVETPGLPKYYIRESLQTEYFQAAIDRLLVEENVLKNGVGVIAVSFSGSIAIAMAECCKKVKCVVWINGLLLPMNRSIVASNKIFPPVDIDNDQIHDSLSSDESNRKPFALRPCFKTFYGDSKIKTGIEHKDFKFEFQWHFDVAYMFIAGLADNNVQSENHINYAESLLKQAQHPSYKIYRYPGAGHLIEPPYSPLNNITNFVSLFFMDWGGKPIPHCRSQEHSWNEQLKFLKESIIGASNAKL